MIALVFIVLSLFVKSSESHEHHHKGGCGMDKLHDDHRRMLKEDTVCFHTFNTLSPDLIYIKNKTKKMYAYNRNIQNVTLLESCPLNSRPIRKQVSLSTLA